MQKYELKVTKQAMRDLAEIIGHIKNELLEPSIAEKFSKEIDRKLKK